MSAGRTWIPRNRDDFGTVIFRVDLYNGIGVLKEIWSVKVDFEIFKQTFGS